MSYDDRKQLEKRLSDKIERLEAIVMAMGEAAIGNEKMHNAILNVDQDLAMAREEKLARAAKVHACSFTGYGAWSWRP
jgi:uncharacterized protein YigA (DUF484 family)